MAEPSAAEYWEAVAKRTRAVSEQWRALHASEEARADEAQSLSTRALAALRRAEEDRDTALKKADSTSVSLSASRQEQARWRARSEAQTASKNFVLLEETREELGNQEAALAGSQRAHAALQLEFDAYKAARRREEAERDATTRERLDLITQQRDDAFGDVRALQQQLDAAHAELSEQLATSPPGALAQLRQQCARHEATIAQLETRAVGLRRESTRWRERARGALASERLTQLTGAPAAMPPPARASFSSRAPPTAADDSSAASTADGEEVDEAVRAQAEADFWRREAEHEVQRQRLFQQALWASEELSQKQKQRLMAWLREPPTPPADDTLPTPQSVSMSSPRDAPGIGGGRGGDSGSFPWSEQGQPLSHARPRRA